MTGQSTFPGCLSSATKRIEGSGSWGETQCSQPARPDSAFFYSYACFERREVELSHVTSSGMLQWLDTKAESGQDRAPLSSQGSPLSRESRQFARRLVQLQAGLALGAKTAILESRAASGGNPLWFGDGKEAGQLTELSGEQCPKGEREPDLMSFCYGADQQSHSRPVVTWVISW